MMGFEEHFYVSRLRSYPKFIIFSVSVFSQGSGGGIAMRGLKFKAYTLVGVVKIETLLHAILSGNPDRSSDQNALDAAFADLSG